MRDNTFYVFSLSFNKFLKYIAINNNYLDNLIYLLRSLDLLAVLAPNDVLHFYSAFTCFLELVSGMNLSYSYINLLFSYGSSYYPGTF